MTFTHTPSRSVFIPDHVRDDESGKTYTAIQDIDAADPRGQLQAEQVALWAYREPSRHTSVAAEKPEGNLAIEAFARFYENLDPRAALETTQRYLAVFRPEARISVEIKTIRGDSQSDWLDVVAAVAEGYGTAESFIDEFRMWAFGEVWTVIPDGGAGISSIYADGPEEAVEFFQKNFEDTFYTHTIELVVRSESAEESQSRVEQIVAAIHDSDALPSGVRVRSFTEATIEH